MSASENPTTKAATVSPEERRAIKRQLVLRYGLALMLGAIVFLIWRVNELAHAVDQMQFGR